MRFQYGNIQTTSSSLLLMNILITGFIFLALQLLLPVAESLSMLSFELMGLVAVIVYMWLFLSFMLQDGRLNLYIIFIIMSFMFYFGQHFILLCGRDFIIVSHSLLGERLSISSLHETGILIIESMLLLHMGYLLSTGGATQTEKAVSINAPFSKQSGIKAAGIILFYISVVPTMIILFNKIFATIQVGYGELSNINNETPERIDSILNFLAQFFEPSLFMLIIAYRGSIKIKYVLFIIVMYLSLYFMSGNRFSAVFICLLYTSDAADE